MRAYDELAKLQKLFFDSYLKQENLVKQYKKLHKQQIRFLKILTHVRDANIEKTHNIICSLHLLRFRCNDLSLFEICARELQGLQKTSVECLKSNGEQSVGNFLSAIHAFETIFNHTLSVAARDPIIFKFFIQDLYALHKVFNEVSIKR